MTAPPDTEVAVQRVLDLIQNAWREGRPEEMAPVLCPNITFVFPGFSMRLTGRDRLIDSYRDFLAGSRLRSYQEDRRSIEGGASAALAEIAFDMTYDRAGSEWRAHGIEISGAGAATGGLGGLLAHDAGAHRGAGASELSRCQPEPPRWAWREFSSGC